jgi:hypothetical protein
MYGGREFFLYIVHVVVVVVAKDFSAFHVDSYLTLEINYRSILGYF